jgi:hypothetical protein
LWIMSGLMGLQMASRVSGGLVGRPLHYYIPDPHNIILRYNKMCEFQTFSILLIIERFSS